MMIKIKKNSIMTKILLPMTVIILIQLAVLTGIIYSGGVIEQLKRSSYDVLSERVEARTGYLENDMNSRWSDVELTVNTVNQTLKTLLSEGIIDFDSLDNDPEEYNAFLEAVSNDMILLMRRNSVTGTFIVLNTQDLDKGEKQNKPGLYIRDLDPSATPSVMNTDLMLERAPTALTKKLDISLDSSWRPQFEFLKNNVSYYPFFYEPFQAAIKSPGIGYKDLGYWSHTYTLCGDNRGAIAYSVPLIYDDGTVYGVLGIEISIDFLAKQLPYDEIIHDKKGSYVLGITDTHYLGYNNVLCSGTLLSRLKLDNIKLTADDTNTMNYIDIKNSKFHERQYYYSKTLDLYNSNVYFARDNWTLTAFVKENDLFEFADKISRLLYIAIIATVVAGMCGVLVISYNVTKPISKLVDHVKNSKPDGNFALEPTQIYEIDRLADAIERLSVDLMEDSTKFATIIEMASSKIGGFEIWDDRETIFITDRFFEVFNLNGIDTRILNKTSFLEILSALEQYIEPEENREGEYLFKIPVEEEESYRWVSMKYANQWNKWIGLAEDVTESMMQLKMMQHERDYDYLTDIVNRRAFYRIINRLFESNRSELKVAALVMVDLDNLKRINDTFGHAYGDTYIQKAVECMKKANPKETIIARISGDEFFIFYYGYDSKDEIRRLIAKMQSTMSNNKIILPDATSCEVCVSGGVAWYPYDCEEYEKLIRYADFAMYTAKSQHKGTIKEFNLTRFQKEETILLGKKELNTIIEKQLIIYHFQPIIDAQTGEVFAYEALMRSNMEILRTPYDILTLARKEFKLREIERLTLFKAMEAFCGHMRAGRIHKDCKVFINSIPNQLLTLEEITSFESIYREYLHLIVPEMTEEERVVDKLKTAKLNEVKNWSGEIAIDDFGSGYNSQALLLSLSPKYVKIDMEIIHDIHKDLNKEKIVESLISYAHERGILVVAEGLECEEEVEKVISMGIDLLQGYYCGRPSIDITNINVNLKNKIASLHHTCFN
ncbi:EAL domain-containing protein [Clostridium aminobutyricum]|uniref:EAL domain-containing protein n=1 Tax=Clostridium aminobutyricum TaxID=33953 RepID=A0A939IHB3_CLOAM|nr:EAL domain-containing protein [Clostridium aminobutyricum]MBN7773517.1 EAL domain-containing protein [Clostridium aminobutyricum]